MKRQLLGKVLITLCLIGMSTASMATDGYFSLGYGTINKGLAGAGTAFYQASLIGGNPAGNVFNSSQWNLAAALFNPNRQYTITGNPSMMPGTFGLTPGTVKSDSKYFIMPSVGRNWKINDKSALTFAFYGNGGMNSNYPTATFYDPSSSSTGVNLAQMFLDVAYSYKLAEKHSIGVSGLFAYQYFSAKGLASFGMMSSDPTKLSGNGTDNSTGFGLKIGYLGELFDGFWLGAKYQSKIYSKSFSDYAGLFAEQGKFEVPSNWSVGIAYNLTPTLTAIADVKRINYSESKAVANPMMTSTGMNPLGADNGAGFGWKDVTAYKFALSYSGIETWTLRAGYSFNNQPIPSSEVMFNILAPAVIQSHLALGCSKQLNDKGTALNFAFNYALNNSVSGPNPMEIPGQQTIKIEMNQIEFEVGITF
jgi:Long-chain fatty acid transport protein